MPISRTSPPLEPVRHLKSLDQFEGKWVAVRGAEVVAVGETSQDVVRQLRNRGMTRAVVQFVPPPASTVRVGLG